MQNQRGFSSQAIVIITVVLVVLLGTGYLVLSRQLRNDEPVLVPTQNSEVKEPNGSPDDTIKVVEQQINSEVIAEIDSMNEEDKQTDLDSSVFDDLEGAIDEANL